MPNKKIVILDGTGRGDDYLAYPFSVLTDILSNESSDLKCYHLKDIQLAHCTGCFGCWVKTPGICTKPDEGREIIQNIIQSDMTVLFSPVTFGGYSSTLKIMVDRFIPIVFPFFGKYHGETHHVPRYSSYPRLVGIGVQRQFAKEEADLFKALVGRNAINFHAPSFAADVFVSDEEKGSLDERLKNAISRSDPFPLISDIEPFFPKAEEVPVDNKEEIGRNALLIIGSPKVKDRSTSSILGEFLIDIMKSHGWNIEILTLKASLNREKGQAELCSAVDRSDQIIFAFPLYIDSLPYLVTKAIEVIAHHKKTLQVKKPQKLFTLINNGFPEFHHNALALAICRFFAEQSKFFWSGALAMGAGEAIGGGKELTETKRSGPPVKHVIEALEKAGADLANGMNVSQQIQKIISKSPIPILPHSLWRWMFKKLGGQWWKKQAIENEVKREEMYAKPYAD